MMRRFSYLTLLFLIGFCFSACQEKEEKNKSEINWSVDHSTEANQRFTKEEELRIKLYEKQHKSEEYVRSGTGLRYWIYEQHGGELAQSYDYVTVRFEIRKLDNTLLYKTEKEETSRFKLDKSDVESGVMEALKKMGAGDKAKLIIPSHIAHGLFGDFDKIPPLTVLVVDIELVNINR